MTRMSVPLVMAAAATSVGAPAYAAGSKHERTARASTRTHHERILRRGATGPDVVRLQRALGITADGIFGRNTERAVLAFQRSHGILVDGEVGPQTWGTMGAGSRGHAGTIILRLYDRGPAVAEVQRALGIPADGDYGPVTVRAVRAFQARHGLFVDGQVGPHTSAALHVQVSGPVTQYPHRTSTPSAPSSGGGGGSSAPSGVGARAALLARDYLGVPYRWGGSSPSGFDCSGLVYFVYGRLGVTLPRVTYSQWNAGRHVLRSQLAPGDLVFFYGHSHVGIYIGGGRFIHSPHTGTSVQIASLSGWYSSVYDGAVRVG
jgi:cell wall-associated NlpC family hydrolase